MHSTLFCVSFWLLSGKNSRTSIHCSFHTLFSLTLYCFYSVLCCFFQDFCGCFSGMVWVSFFTRRPFPRLIFQRGISWNMFHSTFVLVKVYKIFSIPFSLGNILCLFQLYLFMYSQFFQTNAGVTLLINLFCARCCCQLIIIDTFLLLLLLFLLFLFILDLVNQVLGRDFDAFPYLVAYLCIDGGVCVVQTHLVVRVSPPRTRLSTL